MTVLKVTGRSLQRTRTSKLETYFSERTHHFPWMCLGITRIHIIPQKRISPTWLMSRNSINKYLQVVWSALKLQKTIVKLVFVSSVPTVLAFLINYDRVNAFTIVWRWFEANKCRTWASGVRWCENMMHWLNTPWSPIPMVVFDASWAKLPVKAAKTAGPSTIINSYVLHSRV